MKKKQLLIKTIFVLCIFAVISVFPAAVNAAGDQTAAATESSSAQAKNEKNSSDLLKTILIALGISVAATGITVFLIAHGYKTNGKTEPYPYNKKAPLDLSVNEDIHVDTRLEKRKKEKNDNN